MIWYEINVSIILPSSPSSFPLNVAHDMNWWKNDYDDGKKQEIINE